VAERFWRTMNPAAFLVDGDEGRKLCSGFPERAAEPQDLLRLAAIVGEEDETAKAAFFNDQSLVSVQRSALNADHEHLADFFS